MGMSSEALVSARSDRQFFAFNAVLFGAVIITITALLVAVGMLRRARAAQA